MPGLLAAIDTRIENCYGGPPLLFSGSFFRSSSIIRLTLLWAHHSTQCTTSETLVEREGVWSCARAFPPAKCSKAKRLAAHATLLEIYCMQHACYMQLLTEYMQIVTCLLLWLTTRMLRVTCRDLGRFFHMLHAGFMQVSCRLQSCQHVLMDACFMTVTCRRDAWRLHVTSMLPVHNMQVSCMQHAEFIQITCMQHAEFIQITCMQHDDFLHVL